MRVLTGAAPPAEPASAAAREAEILELDLRGLKCPLPALRTRKALRALPEGRALVVTCTDPMAAVDIPNLVREEGARLDGAERAGGTLSFRITASAIRPQS